MHPCDGLFDSLVGVLQTTLSGLGAPAHLVRWRVSHAPDVEHLVFRHTLLAQGLEVAHAKHVDRTVMFGANGVLLNVVHLRPHLVLHHLMAPLARMIVTHFYLIALKVIDRG